MVGNGNDNPHPHDHGDDTRPPDEAAHVEQQGEGEERELVLVKNGQRYVFRCAPGEEPQLLSRLTDLVMDPNIDLDWFDAAVLSHQIGQRLGRKLQSTRNGLTKRA